MKAAKRKSSEPLLISQSKVKTVNDYVSGNECGFVTEAIVKGTYPRKQTPSQHLGCFVEYLVFGIIPRDGVIPQPEYLKSSLKKLKDKKVEALGYDDMTAPYRTAYDHAEKAKGHLKRMGVKILAVNEYIKKDDMHGYIDARVTAKIFGGEIILDCKYSGLPDDKWSPYGWALEREEQIKVQGIQPKHYNAITGLPFYFMIISSTNGDIKFIKAGLTDHSVSEHLKEVDQTRMLINMNNTLGWEPRPSFKKCSSCPLFQDCGVRAWHPDIITVDF